MSGQQEEKGTFEQISLALLMIRALDRRWTGTLTIEAATGERELLEFQRGLVCRALVPDQHARLGKILVDAKVITPKELDVALEESGLLGAALEEQSLIDEKTLQRALVLQLLNRTSRLFGLALDTKWSFTGKLDVFAGMPEGVRVDTLRILWAGISAHGEMGKWLDLTLNRIGESPFQVRAEVNLRRYGFTGDARRVVRLVRDERLTLPQLLERNSAPEEVVKQIVYLLAITRYLDFAPVGGVDSAPPISSTTGESAVADEPSISDDSTVDESSASEGPISSEDQPEVKKPRRVARIKLRRVAVRPAAPDPPGSGEHRAVNNRSSSETIDDPTSSDRVVSSPSDSPTVETTDVSTRSSSDVPSSDRAPGSDRAASSDAAPSSDSVPSSDRVPDSDSDATGRGPGREQLSAEIASRLDRLSRETPFSLLNVGVDAVRDKSDDELTDVFWEAYEECSRQWHPDNCPNDLSDLREGMAKIYDAMTEAFMEVTESKDRHALIRAFIGSAQEDASVDEDVEDTKPPSSGERPVEDPKLSPIELHAKALVALSEQRLDEALRLCRAACEAKPDDPDYLASSVWIRASMEKPDTKVLLLDLDGVLRDHPGHIQARFYRGVLRRRLGSDNAARRDFERVLELKEKHAGAKAQLAALDRGKKKARK